MSIGSFLSLFRVPGACVLAAFGCFAALEPAHAGQPGDELPASEDSASYKVCTPVVERGENGEWLLPGGSRIVRVVPDGPRREDGSLAFVPGVCVLLPPGYEHSGLRYPVIYALHGGADQQGVRFPELWDAVMQADASKRAIIVGPDGSGLAGWFDRFDNNITAIQNLAYREQGAGYGRTLNETYVIDWVLPYVDRHFRTISTREGRGLWGISNGGHGAALLAAKRPDLFSVASIESGNIDWVSLNGNQELTLDLETGRYSPAYRAGHLPANLAVNLDQVHLIFDIASSCDPAAGPEFVVCLFQNVMDQLFLQGNRKLQAALQAAGHRAENDYRETVGGHTEAWWGLWLEERHLPFLLKHLADPQPAGAPLAESPVPESFSYRSISGQFSVHGYEVSVAREVTEFADFWFSQTGITAFGSGKATVLTAPRYRPMTAYQVTGLDDAGTPRRIVSDAAGRLRLEFDLGPSNQAEYSGDYGDLGIGAPPAQAVANPQPGVRREASIAGPGVTAGAGSAPDGAGGGAMPVIPLLLLLGCAGLRRSRSCAGAAALFSAMSIWMAPASAQDGELDELLEPTDVTSEAPPPQAAAVEAPAAEPASLDTIPLAQKSEPLPAAPRQGPAQIEEIVVTATKREQSIRDIPASISAFSGEKLESSGKLGLNDFLQESPGVTVAQGSPGFSRMTFRGISTDTNPTAPNAQPVGVFIGDVPFTDPYIANVVPDLSAFDLAGVEVLKGPQGTLFGGAALSGAVRYQLQEPLLDTWQFRGFSQVSQPRDGSMAFTHGVAFNAPLEGRDLALRMNYVHREYPGVMDDLRSGKDDVEQSSGSQIRAQLLWQPGDWKMKLTHLTQDYEGDNQLLAVDQPGEPRETDRAVLPTPAANDFGMASLEITRDFSALRVVSLTARVHRDAMFTSDMTPALIGKPPANYPPALGALSTVIDNSESLSQELRLQSNDGGPFNWLVGGYYFDYEMFFNIHIDLPANNDLLGPGSLLGDSALLDPLLQLLGLPNLGAATALLDGTSNAESNEKALFADVSYDFDNGLSLSAGGRYYQTEVTGGFIGTGLLVAGNQNDGIRSNSVATLKERGFNPKLSATYHFSDDVSVYAAAAKGFRFGGLQNLPSTPTNGVPATYKSDTLWNYELGLRTNWLDKTLQADLTAFYIRYKDPIITQQTQGIPINYNTNVSAAVSRGLEGSLLWNTPIPGLSWSLAGGLTDAHITEQFTASNGQTVEPGQEMPGSAKLQASTSLQSLLPWRQFLLVPTLGYTYVGKGYSGITHDVEINGFGTLNAGLAIGAEGLPGSPKLAINVSNLLDETAVTTGSVGTSIATRQPVELYLLNPPRTITARFSVEF